MSINDLGYIFTMVTFLASFYSFTSAFLAAHSGRERPLRSAVNWAHIAIFSVSITIFILLYQFYTSDFHNSYVSSYSNVALPLFYKISALWAGQEGSLLFWSWILFICIAITISLYYKKKQGIWIRTIKVTLKRNKTKEQALKSKIGKENYIENYMDPLFPYVLTVVMGLGVFFSFINFYASNPFLVFSWLASNGVETPFFPVDGKGLNPLLQHPAMVFHPPTLYLGFVGFTIPFAFAIAALWTNRLGNVWIKTIRRWTIISWLFLTAGIILGGIWAYVELGWGGYWAWDPVENASFLPWLTATAFVHSVIIQEKRGMLKVWNICLILITFALVIFGTFITRSGIVSSVHSFAQSNVGTLFGILLLGIIFLSFFLVITRLKYLKSEHKLDSIISRESSFLFNNFILLAMTFSIFWGVIFPVISELFTNQKITVGPNFFNTINVPLGLFLLFLTGVGPMLAWRKTSKESLLKNVMIPIIPMIIVIILLLIMNFTNPYFIITIGLSVFVIIGILIEFYRGIRAGIIGHGLSFWRSFVRLMRQKQRRYGGYIVHFGIVLMFIGFSGNAFNLEKRQDLTVGESLNIGEFNITLVKTEEGDNPNYHYIRVNLSISKNGKFLTTLRPEKRKYHASQQPTTEVDIYQTIARDLYLVLEGIREEKLVQNKDNKSEKSAKKNTKGTANRKIYSGKQLVDIHAYVKPLVSVIWIGGFIIILGIIIVLLPKSRERKRKLDRANRGDTGKEAFPDSLMAEEVDSNISSINNFRYQELLEKKNSYLFNIKDLDDDWTIGKFGKEDYERMRNEYVNELALVLSEMDELITATENPVIAGKQEAKLFISQEVDNYKHTYFGTPLRSKDTVREMEHAGGVQPIVASPEMSGQDKKTVNFCSNCGNKVSAGRTGRTGRTGESFCSGCGQKL